MLTTLNKFFKSMKWLMLISGTLIVILGITMLFTPLKNFVRLIVFISISVLISGVSEIASFFSEVKERRYCWMLASGIITTLFSVWILSGRGTEVLAAMFPYVFALWVLLSGIMHIAGSIFMKSESSGLWVWILAFGILGMILGFLLLFSPVFSERIVSYLIGFLLISYGIDKVIIFFRLKKTGDHVRNYLDRLP